MGALLKQAPWVLGVAALATAAVVLPFGFEALWLGETNLWMPVLAPIALGLWAGIAWRERKGLVDPRHTAVLLGLALAVFAFHHTTSLPGALTGGTVRAWSQFHYYVGSKYLGELGWFDLYGATVAADEAYDGPEPGFEVATSVRDMRTYTLRPRAEILAEFDPTTISPERLAQLGRDTRWLRRHTDDEHARRVLMDLGYNPAPPWTLLGTPVANAIELGGPAYPLITSSDLWMHVIFVLAMLWGFGARPAILSFLWIHAIPLNETVLIGGFFNFDWLAATALALAAWQRDRPVLSAVALSWAAMTRVFPGFLALPILVRVLYGLVKNEHDPRRLRFAATFVPLCALLFVASHGTGRGLQTWPEWAEKISLHSAHHPTSGARRVGLAKLAQHRPDKKGFLRTPRHPKGELARSIKRRKHVAMVLGLGLLLFAIRRRSDAEAMLLTLFAVWLLTTSSRYYASVWALLFALPVISRGRGPPLFAAGVLLAMSALFRVPGGHTANYLAFNYGAAVLWVGLCLLYLREDRR